MSTWNEWISYIFIVFFVKIRDTLSSISQISVHNAWWTDILRTDNLDFRNDILIGYTFSLRFYNWILIQNSFLY